MLPARAVLVRLSCCGLSWVGADRAHCCARFGGCGAVFDTPEVFDTHRTAATTSSGLTRCLDPAGLDLVVTKNGIWTRPGP
ncbi:hypothetical protein FVA95_24755 [Pseudonocardia sp. EV170527-09]|nr:hypothetical protein FVA95_24755 [Pseudonocardia sp. EV170527-09]